MKHVNYSFTESDVETCLFALTKLDSAHDYFDVFGGQAIINKQCALSAGEKLASGNLLAPNELHVLCVCITFCALVCQDPSVTDLETYQECMKYIFSLNKLDEALCSQIM